MYVNKENRYNPYPFLARCRIIKFIIFKSFNN